MKSSSGALKHDKHPMSELDEHSTQRNVSESSCNPCTPGKSWLILYSTVRHRKLLKRFWRSLRNETRVFLTVAWAEPQCPQCRIAAWWLPTAPGCLWHRHKGLLLSSGTAIKCQRWIPHLLPSLLPSERLSHLLCTAQMASVDFPVSTDCYIWEVRWSNTTSLCALCFVFKAKPHSLKG